MTETRYQRIGREQRERQIARERMAAERRGQRRKRNRNQASTAWARNADRIDGYDRDDTGLSPDF